MDGKDHLIMPLLSVSIEIYDREPQRGIKNVTTSLIIELVVLTCCEVYIFSLLFKEKVIDFEFIKTWYDNFLMKC